MSNEDSIFCVGGSKKYKSKNIKITLSDRNGSDTFSHTNKHIETLRLPF